MSILVQPLLELKAIASNLHGVLGQDVLRRSNYLIDNLDHQIVFDLDGSLLLELSGSRVNTSPVHTRTGDVEARLISVPVYTDSTAEPLQLLLDSGADMVVLQPRFGPANARFTGTKWVANDDGKRSPAATFRTTLSVGTQRITTEAWTSAHGLDHLKVDGLISTGCFHKLYISNTGAFAIFEPKRTGRHRALTWWRHTPSAALGKRDGETESFH